MDSFDGDDFDEVPGTIVIGRRVLFLETVDSTNAETLRRARAGEREGLVVLADRQTAGRGRLDRVWESPPGKNLHLTALLRPAVEPDSLPLLSILGGIAACEVLRDGAGVFTVLKWPNDVILEDRKICGILTETESAPDGVAVALGIGVDVNADRSDFSAEVADVAASLKMATGQRFDRRLLARMLIRRLDEWYARFLGEGSAPVVSRWSELSGTLGHKVRVRTQAGTIRGKAVRMGRDGALVLRTEDGERRVTAGDVVEVARSA